MSRGQSAFQVLGDSTGVGNNFQLRQSHEGSDITSTISSETQSETQSSIPELSRAEELAIKRSSATFAPIGQAEGQLFDTEGWGEGDQGRMSHAKGDFVANWRPSNNLMMSIDRTTGPRSTTEWDGDGLEVSQRNTNPAIGLIPTHVRGSTPDSVASSGHMRISRGHGEHTDINMGNLQAHAEHRPNNPFAMDMAKSTRAFVLGFNTSDDQPGTSTAGIYLEDRQSNPDETDGPRNQKQEEKPEKSRFFLPKCLLLVVILMMIIAGIVALIVKFKEDEPEGLRGHIVPDPITHVECPSRSFSLGGELNFTCIFDMSHEHRKVLNNATRALIRPKNRALTDGIDQSLPHSFTNSTKGPNNTFVFITELSATCSSAGSYDVIFQNEDKEHLHTATVNFAIKTSSLTTTFIQRQPEGQNCTKTVFEAKCELRNDCNNYHTTFFRNKNGEELSLNQFMSCERDYTDAAGYSVNCSAELQENLVEDFVSIGCKMDTNLKDSNRPFQLRKYFLLPSCEIRDSCLTYIPPNARPFNCSEKSKDVGRLNNGTCDFGVLRSCLKPGRQIFNFYKDYLNTLTCTNDTTTRLVCRLSWCRDYNYVVKYEIPGVAICKNQYEEPYVTPPTQEPTLGPTEEP